MAPIVCPSAAEFQLAYSEHFENTLRFILSRGASLDIAHDITQAAWLRAWERLQQLRDPLALPYWVNTIALNIFRSEQKTQQKRCYGDPPIPCVRPDIDRRIHAQDCLARCKSDFDRQLLVRYYFYGHTEHELAESYGLSPIAVRVRLHRARKSTWAAINRTFKGPERRISKCLAE